MIHQFDVTIYHEDTDIAGVVYYANYFKFIERARSEAIRAAGVDQIKLKNDGMFFVVRKIEADFLSPARFGYTVTVDTLLQSQKGAVIDLKQSIRHLDTQVFNASVKLVLVKNQRPVRISNGLKNKLMSLF